MNTDIRSQIQSLADKYAKQLDKQITHRMQEMLQDDRSHYLIYRVLGIHEDEGMLIDAYQNRGRFLYKYAGAFLEEACVLCIQSKYPDAKKTQIPNTSSSRPKNFEIDCLVGFGARNQMARCNDGWGSHYERACADSGDCESWVCTGSRYVLLPAARAGTEDSECLKDAISWSEGEVLCR